MNRVLFCFFVLGICYFEAWSSEGATNSTATTSRPGLAVNTANVPSGLTTLFSPENSCLLRCEFAQELGNDLSAEEVNALLQFIAADPGDVGLSRSQFNTVGDVVINTLERQHSVPPALIDCLIEMFRDEGGNYTWRDYCIQHLGSTYAKSACGGKRGVIRQVWEEALDPETHMSGTALLAMRRNIGQEGISKAYVAERAAAVALDEVQLEDSRLTAIQVAAELGRRDMLPLARDVIASNDMSVSFRMSAMAVVGMLGNVADLNPLTPYTASPDMRLRLASRAAVKKIESRLKE